MFTIRKIISFCTLDGDSFSINDIANDYQFIRLFFSYFLILFFFIYHHVPMNTYSYISLFLHITKNSEFASTLWKIIVIIQLILSYLCVYVYISFVHMCTYYIQHIPLSTCSIAVWKKKDLNEKYPVEHEYSHTWHLFFLLLQIGNSVGRENMY